LKKRKKSGSLHPIQGLIVSVLTPFTKANALDKKALIRHLAFLHDHNIETILVNGTAGEFFSLTHEEKRHLVKTARANFPGVVILQAGSDSLADSIALARFGEDIGVDAIASLPPYYLSNAPKQGIIDYFNCFSGSISVPFILYNFPKHTQLSINPEILSAVSHYGVKDSSATVSLAKYTRRYYIGSDRNIIKAYKAGACGFVSVRANFFPELYVFLEKALNDQNIVKARAIHREITALAVRYAGPNQIAMIKYAVTRRLSDYPVQVRLPLVQLSTDEIKMLGNAFYK
jgi:dihydrodipicolinate synthase/N-acetylneuraminate lyase